jgi:hypothetical protein
VIEYYIEKPAFTWLCLSFVKDIMMTMPVPLVESLCQTVMGWILALEYLLSGACGLLRPRPIMSGNKCYRFLKPRRWWRLSSSGSPRVG